MMRLWPDYGQECNALIPQLHEHDNLGEFVAISTKRIQVPTCLNIHADDKELRRKAHWYQNHGEEVWVRMRNIPMNFL